MAEMMLIAGVDEVGGGDCIAGPIVAAAVVFDLSKPIPKAISSMKETKALRREGLSGIERRFEIINETCECWRVGAASATDINILRTGQCRFIAMGRAVGHLSPRPRYIKTDGDLPIPCANIGYYVTQKERVKYDELSWLVACASIVARYTRDTLMVDIHNCDERAANYGFNRNYGRSTKAHMDAIIEHGVSPYHRTNYREVRSAMCAHIDKMEKNL